MILIVLHFLFKFISSANKFYQGFKGYFKTTLPKPQFVFSHKYQQILANRFLGLQVSLNLAGSPSSTTYTKRTNCMLHNADLSTGTRQHLPWTFPNSSSARHAQSYSRDKTLGCKINILNVWCIRDPSVTHALRNDGSSHLTYLLHRCDDCDYITYTPFAIYCSLVCVQRLCTEITRLIHKMFHAEWVCSIQASCYSDSFHDTVTSVVYGTLNIKKT